MELAPRSVVTGSPFRRPTSWSIILRSLLPRPEVVLPRTRPSSSSPLSTPSRPYLFIDSVRWIDTLTLCSDLYVSTTLLLLRLLRRRSPNADWRSPNAGLAVSVNADWRTVCSNCCSLADPSESRLSVIAVDSTHSSSVDFVKDIRDGHIGRSFHWKAITSCVMVWEPELLL